MKPSRIQVEALLEEKKVINRDIESFNYAILVSLVSGLEDGGHSYDVIELYDIGFDPCFKLPDLAQFTGGQMPEDVL